MEASQGDIKWALRNVKSGLKATLDYVWVESHQDHYKLWHHLSLEQQLNCFYNSLAKEAVQKGASACRGASGKLPQESAAAFIQGHKQTLDVSTAVWFALGLKDVECFYTTPIAEADARGQRRGGGLGWSKPAFNVVAWEELDAVLARKGQMYRQWLSKQSSGFCGTQSMVARWDTTRDDK